MKIKDNSHYGKDKDSLNFWKSHRNKLVDLYKSERKFFPCKVQKCKSFLDVGCAAGGFYKIINSIKKKKFNYTGIDVSNNLISIARQKYSNHTFKVYNGKIFPSKIKNYDLIFSFGTLHHSNYYSEIIKQMIRKAKKYVIFDLRFTSEKNLINRKKSFQKIKFGKNFVKKNNIPYNILNFYDFINDILVLTSKKYSIEIYGYYHKPNSTVVTSHNKNIIMAAILINKLSKFDIKLDIN